MEYVVLQDKCLELTVLILNAGILRQLLLRFSIISLIESKAPSQIRCLALPMVEECPAALTTEI